MFDKWSMGGINWRIITDVIMDFLYGFHAYGGCTTAELQNYVNGVLSTSFTYNQLYHLLSYHYKNGHLPIFKYQSANHIFWNLQ